MIKRKRFSKHKKPPKGAWIVEGEGVIYMGASKVDRNLILFLLTLGLPFFGFSLMWSLYEEGVPYISIGVSLILISIIVFTSLSKVRIWVTKDEIVVKNGYRKVRFIPLEDVVRASVEKYYRTRFKLVPFMFFRYHQNTTKAKIRILKIIGKTSSLDAGSAYKDVYKYYFRDIINAEITERK